MPATAETAEVGLRLEEAVIRLISLELGIYWLLCHVNTDFSHMYDLNANFLVTVMGEHICLYIHSGPKRTKYDLLDSGSINAVAEAIKCELRQHYRFFRLLERLLNLCGGT